MIHSNAEGFKDNILRATADALVRREIEKLGLIPDIDDLADAIVDGAEDFAAALEKVDAAHAYAVRVNEAFEAGPDALLALVKARKGRDVEGVPTLELSIRRDLAVATLLEARAPMLADFEEADLLRDQAAFLRARAERHQRTIATAAGEA